MKKVIIVLWAILAFGCSSDEEEKEESHQKTIVLNETIAIDSKTFFYKTEKFLFNNEQLIQHSVSQQYFDDEISQEVNLTYSGNTVTVTTEDLTLVYTLNAEGYASQCSYATSYQNRNYSFSYSADGYLTGIAESIEDTPYSSTALTYENGDLTSITTNLNEISNKIIYEARKESSQYYLPCLGILETYPFSFHTEALYAGLLGKSPRHFTVRTSPEGNDSEYTTYTYQFDEEGNPTQIHSQTTYPLYSYAEDSSTDYPNRRTITITIE